MTFGLENSESEFLEKCERFEGKEALKKCETFLVPANFVYLHGTTLSNAVKIMQTGLNTTRTNTVVIDPIKDVEAKEKKVKKFATYTWKDSPRPQAASVVIVNPFTEIGKRIGINETNLSSFMEKIRTNENELSFLLSFGEIQNQPDDMDFMPAEKDRPAIPCIHTIIPQYLIKGVVFTRNPISYQDSLNPDKTKDEDIVFCENPNCFENLSRFDQDNIVEKVGKMFK